LHTARRARDHYEPAALDREDTELLQEYSHKYVLPLYANTGAQWKRDRQRPTAGDERAQAWAAARAAKDKQKESQLAKMSPHSAAL
jgi:hypothetical protein